MRNALILLAVVALVILAAGAFNNGVAFDVDYVAGTATGVSLFWVSVVIAAIVFVAGLAAAWFALSSAGGARRKLEAELQSTFERLRQSEGETAEARAAAGAAEARVAAMSAAASEADATVAVESEEATVVAEVENETVLAETEDVTVVAETEEATIVAGEAEGETEILAEPVEEAPPADEQTAVTMAGEAAPSGEAGDGEPPAGTAADAPPAGEDGQASS